MARRYRGPRHQPASSDRGDHHVEVSDVLDQFEGRRTLTGNHRGVVVRVDNRCAGSSDHSRRCFLPAHLIAELDLGSVASHRLDFDFGGVVRHHNCAGDVPDRRRVGEGGAEDDDE